MAQTVRARRLNFIALIKMLLFTFRTQIHTLTLRHLQFPHPRRDFWWDLEEAVVYRSVEGFMVD